MSAADNETDQTSPMDSTSDSGVRRVLSPGSIFRQRRESLQLDISTVAREMNLDSWMLEALESDNFSQFGAQVFAKGHLKHYAQYLELDPDDLLFAYYQVAERKETKPVINYPLIMTTEVNQHTLWSKWFMILLGFLAISALFYAAYAGGKWWLQEVQEIAEEHNSARQETRQNVRENSQQNIQQNSQDSLGENSSQLGSGSAVEAADAVVSEPSASEQSVSAPSASEQSDGGLTDSDPVFDTNNTNESPVQEEVQVSTQTAITQSPMPEPERAVSPSALYTFSPASENVSTVNSATDAEVLRFTFVESSWVEVLDDNEQQLIYGMADPGTVRELPLSGPVKVFLGNVAGARITLNGASYTVPPGSKAGRTARFVVAPPVE